MKNVLITGSSHGIGAAAAVAFAKEGYNVGINCKSDYAGAQETARRCEEYGVKTKIYLVDVCSHDGCRDMIHDFIETFGQTHIINIERNRAKRFDNNIVSMTKNNFIRWF